MTRTENFRAIAPTEAEAHDLLRMLIEDGQIGKGERAEISSYEHCRPSGSLVTRWQVVVAATA